MIIYLDTSSLVKIYVDEVGSSRVKEFVDSASVVSTSKVAYAEARAAFARKQKEGGFSLRDLVNTKIPFMNWSRFNANPSPP